MSEAMPETAPTPMVRALVGVRSNAFDAAEILAIAYYRPTTAGMFEPTAALLDARAKLINSLELVDSAIADFAAKSAPAEPLQDAAE